MGTNFKSNRAYPGIVPITDDPKSHTAALMALKEGLEVGQRRTKDVLNSFVRVSDLVAAGVLVVVDGSNGTQFVAGAPADTPLTAAEILAALLTVDGAGSGLDADTLDGHDTGYFVSDVNAETTDTAPDRQTDYLLSYDASAALRKKVLMATMLPRLARACTWVSSVALSVPVNAVPFYVTKAAIIKGVVILTHGGNGACVVDIQKAAFASYPPTTSICGGNKPTISGAKTLLDTTLTSWTTAISAGDVLLFKLDSTSTFTAIFISLLLEDAG